MEAKKTAFYERHIQLHGKIVEFAGYKMPMFYEGIVPEHLTVRKSAGMFDLSHMGEFIVKGDGAMEFIQRIVTNDVSGLSSHKVLYSAMCYPDGGIVDDLLVYRFHDHWMLVVNASNIEKDWNWLVEHKPDNVILENHSDDTALLAIQGPYAEQVLQKLTIFDLSTVPYYTSNVGVIAGEKMLFSRTGYTGEDGFELYMQPKVALKLWDAVAEAGEPIGIKPIGLGARDTLRLEMKYALYGNDIDKTTNPIEAGLGWIVKLGKGDFIGRGVLLREKEEGPKRKLVCIELQERAFPRHGYTIQYQGYPVGVVTSGTFSPSLNKGIAMGYVSSELAKVDTPIEIEVRGKLISAVISKCPFYKKGTVKIHHKKQ